MFKNQLRKGNSKSHTFLEKKNTRNSILSLLDYKISRDMTQTLRHLAPLGLESLQPL